MEMSIKSLIRSSDEILHVLEVYNLPNILNDGTISTTSSGHGRDIDAALDDPVNKKILAVVTHKDEESDWEEGSVFIFQESANEFEINRVIPIYADFTINMAQITRQPQDLQPPSPTNSNQHRSGLRLQITPGDAMEPLDLFTYDVQGLKNVLTESRRLKELADLKPETQTYSWLAPYAVHNVRISPLTSVFPHLQEIHKPLHSRLSAASPGIPGEDAKDIILIRDDWVRTRSRNECRKGRGRLHIRVGTFNVNGKMPSQDLSCWVRGSLEDKGLSILPPLKKVSPFVIDDSNPIESARSQPATFSSEANTLTEASAPASIASASTTSLTFVQTEPEVVSTVPIDQIHPSDPDMLILGFQELDLSTAALTYSTSSVREEAWTTAIFAGLGEKGDMYEKLASKQLVGMLIIIIVKKSLKECFSNVMTSSVGVGIMGYMGNKGGTAIRLTFTPPDTTVSTLQADTNTPTTLKSDTQVQQPKTGSEDFNLGSTALTFVCAHLAAFDEMMSQRNADYHSLGKRFVFDSQTIIPSGSDAEDIPHSLRQGLQEKFSIFESDALFWLGDLNYRVDLPDAEVRTLLQSKHWENSTEILVKYDQLKKAIHHKEAFEIFTEPEITHQPTYRFSPGVLSDSLGYDMKRRPAWTDRVLYVHSPLTTQIQPLAYAGHHEITMSDHRPVSAEFALDVDLFDRYQLHTTATSLFQQVYGMEDLQERSKLKLSETNVDLGSLFYKRQKTYTLSVQNTGKVPVAFRFVPAQQELELHPNWLKISPMTGLLLPNELIEITLTAMVDNDIASVLNTGSRNLSSTLILHTLMGKDLFVVVSATYNYTCFANKISRMTQLPGPVRSLHGPEDLLREDRAINAPREIMRLVNWMMTAENFIGSMFTSPADQDVVDRLRECLDTGEEFPYSEGTEDRTVLVAFGETLRQLLDSLTECLIPVSLHAQCVSATDRDEAFEALDSFPPATVNVWISVTAFLHFVVQQSSDPEGMAQKIAAIFTPVFFGFLRSDVAEASLSTITPLQGQAFILHFIR